MVWSRFEVDVFFVKQKTADEMRISDWSSDVCSSDLARDACRLLRERDLVVMARRRFVIGQRRQRPRRVFGGVAQVDIISAGARAVERGYLVIAARGAGLDLDRKSVVSGKSVSVRVDLGGRRIIKKKKQRG